MASASSRSEKASTSSSRPQTVSSRSESAWTKSSPYGSISSSSKSSTTTYASPAASSSVATCKANGSTYREVQEYVEGGLTYVIHCSADNSAGTYNIVSVSSGGFSKCFSACAASARCRGFTFSGTEFGTCYLKDQEGSYSSAVSTIVSAFVNGTRPSVSMEAVSMQSSSSSSSSKPVPYAPSATPTDSSFNCAAVSSKGGFTPYTSSDGTQYNVACKYEVGGSNLAVAAAPSFGDCFTFCRKTLGCEGFAWLQDDGPGNCYLKSDFNPLSTGGPSNADVAIMVDPAPSGSATGSGSTPSASIGADSGCSSFDGSKYPEFTLECKTDRNGGNFFSIQSRTFEGCFSLCKTAPGCVGFSYAGTTCYLKSVLVEPNDNANVDTAYLTGAASSPSGSASGSTPSATAVPGKRSCQQVGAKAPAGYTAECGSDHYGGDAGAVSAGSFEECFSIRDKRSGCVGVAYTGGSGSGTCYTKSTITPGTMNPGVNFAYKDTDSAPSTTSSVPLPTATAEAGGYPQCWNSCFKQNNVRNADQPCENAAVDKCVRETCDSRDAESYKVWKQDHCSPKTTATTFHTHTKSKRAEATSPGQGYDKNDGRKKESSVQGAEEM